MKFICGCDPNDPYVKNYHPHLVKDAMGRDVLTTKTFNKQGMEICPIHSLPLAIDNIKARGVQGNEITDFNAEYHARYGREHDPRRSLGTAGIEDRRDNRDPVSVGQAAIAERKTERNGCGSVYA